MCTQYCSDSTSASNLLLLRFVWFCGLLLTNASCVFEIQRAPQQDAELEISESN